MRCGAGSQWIVAARPLSHLQYPVAYLSGLQRIQPAAHEEGSFEAACHGTSAGQTEPMHGPLGRERPNVGRGERRAQVPVTSLDSDLEAFCHNPTHGSFAPLAFCNTLI